MTAKKKGRHNDSGQSIVGLCGSDHQEGDDFNGYGQEVYSLTGLLLVRITLGFITKDWILGHAIYLILVLSCYGVSINEAHGFTALLVYGLVTHLGYDSIIFVLDLLLLGTYCGRIDEVSPHGAQTKISRAAKRKQRALQRGYIRSVPKSCTLMTVPRSIADDTKAMLKRKIAHSLDSSLGRTQHSLRLSIHRAAMEGLISRQKAKRLLRINKAANIGKHGKIRKNSLSCNTVTYEIAKRSDSEIDTLESTAVYDHQLDSATCSVSGVSGTEADGCTLVLAADHRRPGRWRSGRNLFKENSDGRLASSCGRFTMENEIVCPLQNFDDSNGNFVSSCGRTTIDDETARSGQVFDDYPNHDYNGDFSLGPCGGSASVGGTSDEVTEKVHTEALGVPSFDLTGLDFAIDSSPHSEDGWLAEASSSSLPGFGIRSLCPDGIAEDSAVESADNMVQILVPCERFDASAMVECTSVAALEAMASAAVRAATLAASINVLQRQNDGLESEITEIHKGVEASLTKSAEWAAEGLSSALSEARSRHEHDMLTLSSNYKSLIHRCEGTIEKQRKVILRFCNRSLGHEQHGDSEFSELSDGHDLDEQFKPSGKLGNSPSNGLAGPMGPPPPAPKKKKTPRAGRRKQKQQHVGPAPRCASPAPVSGQALSALPGFHPSGSAPLCVSSAHGSELATPPAETRSLRDSASGSSAGAELRESSRSPRAGPHGSGFLENLENLSFEFVVDAECAARGIVEVLQSEEV